MPRSTKGLTGEEIDTFHRQGYLVVDDLIAESDLQPVIDEVTEEITARAREWVATGRLSSAHEDLGFQRQLVAINREAEMLLPEVSSGALSGPEIFRLICHPRLLDAAESLCGPELIASSVYRLRPKLPGDPRGEVPWHQDSGYFDPYCDKGLILTVWIPLVDATPENGCLYVLPRSHEASVFPHRPNADGTYLKIATVNLPRGRKAVAAPVRKGGALLMTNRTPHASFVNTGKTVRWSMDLRYQSATLPSNASFSRIESDRAALDGASIPAACYPPSADFLVRSRERPAEVVTDAEVFHRARTRHRALYEAQTSTATKSGERRKISINPFSLRRWGQG